MAFFSDLLGLAARVSLRMVIGETTAGEVIDLFKRHFAAQPPTPQDAAEVRPDEIRSAIQAAALAEGKPSLAPRELADAALSLSLGLQAIASGEAKPEEIVKTLQKRRATYAIWVSLSQIVGDGPGRYVHFNWDEKDGKTSWAVRDYIGGRAYHPLGGGITAVPGLTQVVLDMTALEVWQAGRCPVLSSTRLGLGFGIGEVEDWRRRLLLMTEVARQCQWSAPPPAR